MLCICWNTWYLVANLNFMANRLSYLYEVWRNSVKMFVQTVVCVCLLCPIFLKPHNSETFLNETFSRLVHLNSTNIGIVFTITDSFKLMIIFCLMEKNKKKIFFHAHAINKENKTHSNKRFLNFSFFSFILYFSKLFCQKISTHKSSLSG